MNIRNSEINVSQQKQLDKIKFKQRIEEVLTDINLYSESAVNLLLGTAAQESSFGKYNHQIDGPALGVFQMEPATLRDLWENFLAYKEELCKTIEDEYGYIDASNNLLQYDIDYAIIMCRIHYLRVKERLPDADDIEGLAKYWKKYYNTYKGKGKVEEFIKNYNRYVA